MSDCYPCHINSQPRETLPSRERVYDDGLWRVAHSFNSSLPGWMVAVTRRHVTTLSALSQAEALALGPLLAAVSQALKQVLGVPKAYGIFFAEAEAFAHVHIHVVPRPPEDSMDRRGPNVFAYLRDPEDRWVAPVIMDQIADDLRAYLTQTTEGREI